MGAKQTIKKTTTVSFKTNASKTNVNRCPNCGKYMKGKSSAKNGSKG